MAWYDPFIILVAVIGILMIFFNAHHKRNVTIGLSLLFGALIVKAFLWFESLI